MRLSIASARRLLFGLLLAVLAVLAVPAAAPADAPNAYAPPPAAPAAPTAAVDPRAASYSLGLMFGDQLRSGGAGDAVVPEELQRGLRDALAGTAPTDADKARTAQFLRFARAAVVEANHAKAREFLAANKGGQGVMTTASGLQYAVLAPGDAHAASPRASDRVTVEYRGRLLDGTPFDSSQSHGGNATISLNGGALKGWKEALLLMKPGAQWRLFLPPELGYDASPPPGIPAGALLVYDLTLVGIEPSRTLAPGQAPGTAGAKEPAGR